MSEYPFRDRKDAGRKLASALRDWKDQGVLVLAIPCGGVEVGYEVALALNADLSVIVARKLPFPDNPESGFGAVAEDGSIFLLDESKRWLTPGKIDRAVEAQKQEVLRRIELFRGGGPLPDPTGRTVILVDDGIAMGSTMRVAISACKNAGAGKIIVATPVTGERTAKAIAKLVDEIVIIEKPRFFQAVAQVYENWRDVPDQEVVSILEAWNREH